MKKVFAILLTLLMAFSLAACGEKTEEETTRSQDELVSDANNASAKLTEFLAELTPQLALVNSADGNDGFFDLTGMIEAGEQFDAAYEQIDFGAEELTDGDSSLVDNVVTAKQAADQIREIADKVNSAAAKYYAQFVSVYPDATMTKMYCLTVFMSGEPSSFFAADYTDAEGNAKTVYAISSFTGSTPDDVLATIPAYLFAEAPVASRDATKDGNYEIDLDAIKAAATPASAATDGDAK